MNRARLYTLYLVWFLGAPVAGQDVFDRVDEALTVSAFHDQVRARLSGLADVEEYFLQEPAPGLIYTDQDTLFNPRLSLFLDAQLGSQFYLFAQARLDRGFDPSDGAAEVRADEYALRWTPWEDGRLNIQVGKFGTVVGGWMPRHLSWDNPFVTAPLPYENRTAIYGEEAPSSPEDFLSRLAGEEYDLSPVVWGPSYATGAAVSGRLGKLDGAVEIKNTALASAPWSWDATEVGFDHPTVSGRFGFRPNPAWTIGFSASDGAYYLPEALSTLPMGEGFGNYRQRLFGQDISFAWRHFQLRAEVYEARFDVPNVGHADTLSYYVEAKYKITAQLFGALRWNQQFFGDVPDGGGGRAPWGRDTWRSDFGLGYRFTAHSQLKAQYSLQREAGSEFGHLLAAQFTLRF